jgi:hypothetical protein
MNDQERGEGVTRGGGQFEVFGSMIITEEVICASQYTPDKSELSDLTRVVADARTRAACGGTIAEDTKIDTFEIGNWHPFDDWC